jgi:preprotein translocase subunit SecF
MNKAVSLVLSVFLLLYAQGPLSAQKSNIQEENDLSTIQTSAGGDSLDIEIIATGTKESTDAKVDSLTQDREKQEKAEKRKQIDPELKREKRIALVIGIVFGLVILALYLIPLGFSDFS